MTERIVDLKTEEIGSNPLPLCAPDCMIHWQVILIFLSLDFLICKIG